MRYIDAFNHFFPQRFFDWMIETPAGQKDLGKRMMGIPALYNLDERNAIVDFFNSDTQDYSQVICLGMPSIDRLVGPKEAPEMAKIGNDGLAEICANDPRRYPGFAASLPMNNPTAAIKEAERVLANGANAIQMHTNIDGAPIDGEDLWPLYEVIEKSGRPILFAPDSNARNG